MYTGLSREAGEPGNNHHIAKEGITNTVSHLMFTFYNSAKAFQLEVMVLHNDTNLPQPGGRTARQPCSATTILHTVCHTFCREEGPCV